MFSSARGARRFLKVASVSSATIALATSVAVSPAFAAESAPAHAAPSASATATPTATTSAPAVGATTKMDKAPVAGTKITLKDGFLFASTAGATLEKDGSNTQLSTISQADLKEAKVAFAQNAEIKLGNTLAPKLDYLGASEKTVAVGTWASSNASVLTVENGAVKAVGAGTAKLTFAPVYVKGGVVVTSPQAFTLEVTVPELEKAPLTPAPEVSASPAPSTPAEPAPTVEPTPQASQTQAPAAQPTEPTAKVEETPVAQETAAPAEPTAETSVVTAGGAAGLTANQQAPAPQQPVAPAAPAAQVPFVYQNCAAVWDAVGGPIREGDYGYGVSLDRDRDGVACEQNPDYVNESNGAAAAGSASTRGGSATSASAKTAAKASSARLAHTGIGAAGMATIGGSLLVAGAALVVFARRRTA